MLGYHRKQEQRKAEDKVSELVQVHCCISASGVGVNRSRGAYLESSHLDAGSSRPSAEAWINRIATEIGDI